MADYLKILKNLIFFNEPKEMEKFILKENGEDKETIESERNETRGEPKRRKNEELLLRNKARYITDKEKKEKQQESDDKKKHDISKSLSENLQYMKRVYNVPTNGDIVIREFDIVVKDKVIPAFIIFIDGMTDRKLINDDILQPLMVLSNLDIKSDEKDIAEYIESHILPHNQLKKVTEYQKVIDEVNFGGCGLFVDGMDSAFSCDVKGWEHRGVERPNTELNIRGPQEGFNEIIRVNTALIRKRLKDENLIVENVEIGKRSKTPCSMLYIKNIANDSLVQEIRRRVKSLKVDYINDSGELEQLIEDNTFLPAPQIIATERPDRVASMLSDGKVALVLSGSPFVLVMPTTAHEMIIAAEDAYIRFPYALLLKLVRLMAIAFSLLLPAIYVAVTNFHQEMIPTDLLMAIEASREKVPFPSVIEILIMEVAFEMIREAGIRIPGPIGPTLGIIGALILGQAAVAANIVSPILIIIVAVTGISSFAIPNFSLAFSIRILRFAFILLATAAGFLGITTGLFILGLWIVNSKSFGVPFMTPFAPKTSSGVLSELIRSPIWKQEDRPDHLNTKEKVKQDKISRGWIKQGEGDKENDGK